MGRISPISYLAFHIAHPRSIIRCQVSGAQHPIPEHRNLKPFLNSTWGESRIPGYQSWNINVMVDFGSLKNIDNPLGKWYFCRITLVVWKHHCIPKGIYRFFFRSRPARGGHVSRLGLFKDLSGVIPAPSPILPSLRVGSEDFQQI